MSSLRIRHCYIRQHNSLIEAHIPSLRGGPRGLTRQPSCKNFTMLVISQLQNLYNWVATQIFEDLLAMTEYGLLSTNYVAECSNDEKSKSYQSTVSKVLPSPAAGYRSASSPTFRSPKSSTNTFSDTASSSLA